MMQIIYWIWNERILVLWAFQLDWWQIEYDENGNIIERPNKHNIENLDTIEKDLKYFFFHFFLNDLDSNPIVRSITKRVKLLLIRLLKNSKPGCKKMTFKLKDQDIWIHWSHLMICVFILALLGSLAASIPPPVMNVIQQQGYVTPTLVQVFRLLIASRII